MRIKAFGGVKQKRIIQLSDDCVRTGHAARRDDFLIDKGADRHLYVEMVNFSAALQFWQAEDDRVVEPRINALLAAFARRRLRTDEANAFQAGEVQGCGRDRHVQAPRDLREAGDFVDEVFQDAQSWSRCQRLGDGDILFARDNIVGGYIGAILIVVMSVKFSQGSPS